jgi:hypothetical protein
LTELDLKNNITTIKMKVESECNFFYRLDSLFGTRQNIRPTSVLQPSTYFDQQNISKNPFRQEDLESADELDDEIISSDSEDILDINVSYPSVTPITTSSETIGTVSSTSTTEAYTTQSKPSLFKSAINTSLKLSQTEIKENIKEISKQEFSLDEKSSLAKKAAIKNKTVYGVLSEAKCKELEFKEMKYKEEKELQRLKNQEKKDFLALKYEEEKKNQTEELAIKRQKVEMEKEELDMKKKAAETEARRSLINTLILSGKTPEEIDEHMKVVQKYL